MKILSILLLLLNLGALCAGCQSSAKTAADSQADAALTRPQIPVAAPDAGPGEPQRGFEQQVREAQNP